MIKYTKEQLMKMPLTIVRGLDIKTLEEEKLIQEVIHTRASIGQPIVKFPHIVPDIKNVEQEKEWQNKIDAFNESQAPVEAKIAAAEKTLKVINSEIPKEVQQVATPIVEPSTILVDSSTGTIIKPFCDKCSSKGVRHKKECPLYVPTVKSNADLNTKTVQ